jgi:membrane protein YdbS with pleckstrin-like domain
MTNFDRIPPEFDAVKDDDETILWIGKPKREPFLAQGIPFLIIGCLWGAFDYFFFLRFTGFMPGGIGGIATIFILFHMFPFYAGILNMLRLVLVFKNTSYAYTNKRLMFRTGFFGIDFKSVDYDRIQNIEVNVNPLEKMFNVGTIKAFTGEYASSRDHGTRPIYNEFKAIEDPYEVFKAIKQTSVDIKTDWNYPNNLRPEANDGYKTKYKPKE